MPLPRLVRARVRVRVRVRVRACVRRRPLGYSLHAIHLLHGIVGSRKTAPFQLASPLPAIRGHTKIATGDLDAACYRAAEEKKT